MKIKYFLRFYWIIRIYLYSCDAYQKYQTIIMRHFLLFPVLVLTFFILNPAISQSKDKEVVKSIMTNKWVNKYKKLKMDLENKAIYVKNMEDLNDEELAKVKASYLTTSKMLDAWLDHLVESIHSKNETLDQIAHGDINSDLKEELQRIFTFYADDFSTLYEQTTGQKSTIVIDSPSTDESENSSTASLLLDKPVEVDFLLANVKKPLSPNNWNSIY